MTTTTTLDEMVDPREAHRLCLRSVEFAQDDADVADGHTLEGHGAVFGVTTEIESYSGVFTEEVMPGAFKKTLKERQPVMQFNHGRDKRTGAVPIAAIKDLHEDDDGLFVRARMFDNDVVEPIRQAVEGRAIRGMSIKFEVIKDRWLDEDGKELDADQRRKAMRDGEKLKRQILEIKLHELGPVVFPAFTQTDVGVRSDDFDLGQVAVRGVIAQFDLDEGCIRRHLDVFDADARKALAAEIATTFPELAEVFEAKIKAAADPDTDDEERAVFPSHGGKGVEGTWDAGANQKRLPDPVPLSTARNFYTWYDASKVSNGAIPKSAGKLPHHFVSADGRPGAASINGVNNALARLSSTQGISDDERSRVEAHLHHHQATQSSSDAAEPGTSDTGAAPEGTPRTAEPVPVHSADIEGMPEWYLPSPLEQEGRLE